MPRLLRLAAPAVAIAMSLAVALLGAPASAQTTEQKLPFPVAGLKDPDTKAVTLGVKFTVATAGEIVAVEFHRFDTGNTARAVQLWSPTGALLGSAQTPNATQTGFNRATFATPIPVATGQTFTASYQAPRGRYTARNGGFTAARTDGDLTAPVGAGVYRYGSTPARPTLAFSNSDYYVTPVFVPDVEAPPTTTTTTPTATTEPPPQAVCGDGQDNDADGKTDFPDDPGCADAADTDEADPVEPPPPTGQACPPLPAHPDVNCTGVPAGVALTTVNGNLTTSADNQVIDAKLITGDLVVNHNNVTVTNSRIKGRIAYANGRRDLTLRDVDLGPDACAAGGSGNVQQLIGSDYTLTRVHMHHWNADLLRLTGDPNTSILVEDSLINQTCFYAGDHLDAVQLYDPGSVSKVTIRHTSIDNRPANSTDKGNSAIFWADHPGSGSSLLVKDSKIAGGQIALALYDANSGSGVTLEAAGNIFVRNSFTFDACSSANSVAFNGTEGVKFTGNTFDDGAAIPTC